jgi:hypothetical protein
MTVLSYISDPNDYINWKIAVVANIESIIGIIGYPLLQSYTLHAKYKFLKFCNVEAKICEIRRNQLPL